ncbi:DUF3093 domain-containing protein [Granulicoccus sp. GXG6511]|uniref:DUF3093 domain-containing protein n=1 Tax=Granulicoccus sp. GXG6511 TaxID=3381351 RepID=UPI003D7D3089
MTADPRPPAPLFRERLGVPVRWWLVALFFVVSVFVAVAFYLGPLNGLIAAVLCAGIVAAVLVPYGSLTVTVDERALTVGPNRIEWAWVGGATTLDADAARHRLGPGADVRAHLAVRPYVQESVEVTVVDAADPHPYWLISSRRAAELAAAVNAHAGARTAEEVTDADS